MRDSPYWVLPAARGRGVASGALAALSSWALGVGFWRLELDHSTGNDASCAVAAKCGYALEGVKRSAAVHDDGRHDMHLSGSGTAERRAPATAWPRPSGGAGSTRPCSRRGRPAGPRRCR
ncbi:GNAT family N-acetyltransferase [Streptomyces sp. SID9727]|nr:GNAT family N-acetyltransferase [Streptomyces sp. SID9727]